MDEVPQSVGTVPLFRRRVPPFDAFAVGERLEHFDGIEQLDVSGFAAGWFLTPLIKRRYNPNHRFDLLTHFWDIFLGRLRPIKIFSLARQQRFS